MLLWMVLGDAECFNSCIMGQSRDALNQNEDANKDTKGEPLPYGQTPYWFFTGSF